MNLTFTLCFTVECILKLISYGPGVKSTKDQTLSQFLTQSSIFQSYFKDQWNTFDFVTVVGSIVDALMVEFAVRMTLKLPSN